MRKILFSETVASLDWGTPSFDWSQSTKRTEEDKLELNWDDDDAGEDVDSPPISMKFDKKEPDNMYNSEIDNSKLIFIKNYINFYVDY